MSQEKVKVALKQQVRKLNPARPVCSRSVLASAISAVLVGVYGMPVRADDDYLSPGGVAVSRGDYDLGDNDLFRGRDADSTVVSVEFAMGERWRGQVTYENVDAKDGGHPPIPPSYGTSFGYNLFRVNSALVSPMLDFDMLEFQAGYDFNLGSVDVMPSIGLKYVDLNVSGDDRDATYYSGGTGGVGLGGPFIGPPKLVLPSTIAAAGGAIMWPVVNGAFEQEVQAYGLTFGLDTDFNFSESWGLTVDLGIDYLYADRNIDAWGSYLAVDGSDDAWVTGANGDVSIDYHVNQADEYDAGFTVSVGYHYQSWFDLYVENLSGDETDLETKGPFLKLAVDF
jgi:hypothetical protein